MTDFRIVLQPRDLAVGLVQAVHNGIIAALGRGTRQVGNDALVGSESNESLDAPDGESLSSDRPEGLALDVYVSQESPAHR